MNGTNQIEDRNQEHHYSQYNSHNVSSCEYYWWPIIVQLKTYPESMTCRYITISTTVSKHTSEIVSTKVGWRDEEWKVCAIIVIQPKRRLFICVDDEYEVGVGMQYFITIINKSLYYWKRRRSMIYKYTFWKFFYLWIFPENVRFWRGAHLTIQRNCLICINVIYFFFRVWVDVKNSGMFWFCHWWWHFK